MCQLGSLWQPLVQIFSILPHYHSTAAGSLKCYLRQSRPMTSLPTCLWSGPSMIHMSGRASTGAPNQRSWLPGISCFLRPGTRRLMLVLILMIAFSSWRGDGASSVLALVRPKPLSALGATHITCMISGGTFVVLMCQLILALDGDDQES